MKTRRFLSETLLAGTHIILATASLTALVNLHADTFVSGIVTNRIWHAAGSPYVVTNDILVVGLGLTIQPNVTIQFAGPYEFKVLGRMQALGTSEAPVRFMRQDPASGWKGILFDQADAGSFFNYTIIEGATNSGVRITNTPPAFTNCIVCNNTSLGNGGGILAILTGSPLVMHGCVITNNEAGFNSLGGGLYLDGSSVLSKCTFVDNRIPGSVFLGGGAIYAVHGDCTMRSCSIVGNLGGDASSQTADGIFFSVGVLDMANCWVATNGAPKSAPAGGAIWVYTGTTQLRNCILTKNTRAGICFGGALAMVNCTVTENDAEGIDGGPGATVGVTNSIIYFNNANGQQIRLVEKNGLAAAYSNVQDGVMPGQGNISLNPALCPENLSLITDSPCIDAGSPDPAFNDLCIDTTPCVPGPRGTARNDMGAYGGPGACAWGLGDAPIIVTQPQSQSSCIGGAVTLAVGATGSQPLGYQWFFQNAVIPGQTNAQLTLTNVQSSNAGSYFVIVSNDLGSVTSEPIQLVVPDTCISLQMYAGLTIAGQAGARYVLSYSTDLGNTNGWIPLATNVLGSSPWFYLDMDSPLSEKRYYKAVLKP